MTERQRIIASFSDAEVIDWRLMFGAWPPQAWLAPGRWERIHEKWIAIRAEQVHRDAAPIMRAGILKAGRIREAG